MKAESCILDLRLAPDARAKSANLVIMTISAKLCSRSGCFGMQKQSLKSANCPHNIGYMSYYTKQPCCFSRRFQLTSGSICSSVVFALICVLYDKSAAYKIKDAFSVCLVTH